MSPFPQSGIFCWYEKYRRASEKEGGRETERTPEFFKEKKPKYKCKVYRTLTWILTKALGSPGVNSGCGQGSEAYLFFCNPNILL